MSVDVILPKLGFSMNEGTIAEWLAKDGDDVVEGQPLFTMESDKSTQEVESPASGKLTILTDIGETYDVGTTLARID